MKKFVLLLIAILAIYGMGFSNVKALTDSFYEGEYAGRIYTRRSWNGNIHYQRARFFRQSSTGNLAYCVEPFIDFSDGSNYEGTDVIQNISDADLFKIKLLSYYGYLYPGHEDIRWYAITQQLIWQVAFPSGKYEFTDSLNGEEITPYDNDINQLWSLVNQHQVLPSFQGNSYYLVEGDTLTLTDSNNVLSNYEVQGKKVKIQGNTFTASNLKEGDYIVAFTRKSTRHSAPAVFYHKSGSQALVTLGNLPDITTTITIHVEKTKLELEKVDQDTKTTTPQGEGQLIGAKYGLYNQEDELLYTLIIDNNNQASLENISYGTYYLKEIEAGSGYHLDENVYEVKIEHNKTVVKLQLENEVIKKKVKIHKEYGSPKKTSPEANVVFDIYDFNNRFIQSVTTDSKGNIEIELPYGTYTFKQKTGNKDYQYIDDFQVTIDETDVDLIYNLYDYKVEVPNTFKNKSNIASLFLVFFLGLGCYVFQRNVI